jgi:hypothetical protein
LRQSVVIENPKTSEDWSAIYRLCCETGNNGAPIDVSRHPFFGEYWVGPYKKLRARWCYLAKDSSGQVLGYLTGAPDTLAFEQQKRIHFTAPLFFRVAFGQYGWTSDVKRFIKRTLRFEQGPVDRFAVGDRALANQRFPAHLHMNVASQRSWFSCRSAVARESFVPI